MKILNWIHRKFSHKGENAKIENGISVVIAGDHEKQYFDRLHNDNISYNVFDKLWSGGILTIGTFGYDPLMKDHEENDDDDDDHASSFYEHDQMISDDDDDENDDDDDSEEEKVNPSLFFADHKLMKGKYNYNNYKRMKEDEFECKYVMMEKKNRITLADLFSDEYSDVDKLKQTANDVNVINKLAGGVSVEDRAIKHGALSSLGKKLIFKDARPIRKLQQMMRRMFNRKIHPAVKYCETNGYASLLPSQDATICHSK